MAGAIALPPPAEAADQPVPRRAAVRAHPVKYEDPCGCYRPVYVYHREMLYTYAGGFDPRYTLTSEPRLFLGRVRAYRSVW